MALSNNCSSRFAKYDSMHTEELQQILRDDASNSEGQEFDMDELLYVMDLLANRQEAQHEGKTPEEALESFKQNYCPELFKNSSPVSLRIVAEHKSRKSYWKRGLIAAAAMVVIIMSCTITVEAWGFDLWDTVAKWTRETFHFGYAGHTEETNAPTPDFQYSCASLQESLDMFNITANLVPTWIPEGYSEEHVDVFQTPRQRHFTASYQNEDATIHIKISDYMDSHPVQIEQSEDLIEIYSVNGIDYYIFDNRSQCIAAWIFESYECYISGPLSLEELKDMIDSIEKG